MNRNKHLLVTTSLSALAGLTWANIAGAQQTTKTGDIEEIVVRGIRDSLQSSAQAKKNAQAVAEVITAEDVGKFPDTNVAESLSHLPGLSVDRQFGEGEKVSIQGTDPALNRVFLDGHSVASADWGGNPNDISGRNFNYALLSPEIIGTATVYKSPEAWLDEGSLGGTVMIETRKPLDLNPNTVATSGGYEYNDRSEKGNPRGSMLYSWRTQDSTFGVLAGVNYDKQNLYRAGIEYFGYAKGDSLQLDANSTINGAPANPSSIAELQAARMPCCINFAYFDQTRERMGVNAAVQWRPTEVLQLDLTALHVTGDYTNFSQSEYSVAGWGGPATNITVANGIVTGASVGGTGYIGFDPNNPTAPTRFNTDAQLDTNLRETEVKTDSVNLAAKWNFDVWTVSGNIGATEASGGKDPEYLASFQYGGPFAFGFTQNSTYQNYALDPTDPHTFIKSDLRPMTINGENGYYTQIGGIAHEIYRDKEVYGQFDFTRELENGFLKQVRFGFKGSNHTNSTSAHGSNIYLDRPTDLSEWDWTLSPAGLWSGLGATGNATRFATLTRSGVVALLNSGIYRDNGPTYGSQFKVDEKILAGYLQGNFAVGKLHGNVGTRVVRTRDQSDYWEFNEVTEVWSPRSVTQERNDVLPSLNLVYDITPDFLLKAGVAKVIARPRYNQLAGSFSLNNRQLTGSGGNPNLTPYESTNFELSAEYYFAKHAMVAAEFFHRDISSYIVQKTEERALLNTDTGQLSTYSVTSPVNAQNAKVSGFALQGQTDIGAGFGIAANVTWADADIPNDEYYMPYLSQLTYNVIPYFERGPWQVRLSYSYRDKYFTQIGRRNSKDYTDDYTQFDLSANFDMTEQLSLYAKALNMLDETYYSFSSVTIAPTSFYKNGRQFMVGASFRMQ